MLSFISLVSATAISAGTPNNSWTPAYRDGRCTVERTGSLPNDQVEVTSISWDIVFNYFKVTISAPASGTQWRTTGEPTYAPNGEGISVPKANFSARKLSSGRYQVEVTLSRPWAKSVAFDGLGLKIKDGQKIVSSDGLADAKTLLDNCSQQHLQQLDIAPAEVAYSLTRAVPSPTPSTWFDETDLPRSRSSRALYTPFVIWRVDTTGQPSHCKLVTSSGRPELDSAICSSFMKRVRYLKPAVDQDGNPVASWDGRRISINY